VFISTSRGSVFFTQQFFASHLQSFLLFSAIHRFFLNLTEGISMNKFFLSICLLVSGTAYSMQEDGALNKQLSEIKERKRKYEGKLRAAQRNLQKLEQEIIDFNMRQQDIHIKRECAMAIAQIAKILDIHSVKRGRALFSDENHNPNLISVLKKVKLGD
jgi:hypothetical protein